jgi:hypothetical protein
MAVAIRVTRIFEKQSPNFLKSCPKSLQATEWENIYIKAPLESPKYLHQTNFKTLKYEKQIMF